MEAAGVVVGTDDDPPGMLGVGAGVVVAAWVVAAWVVVGAAVVAAYVVGAGVVVET